MHSTVADVRRRVIAIRRQTRSKEEARLWAESRGYSVTFTRDGIKVRPLSEV
jgi:hypothetical protein